MKEDILRFETEEISCIFLEQSLHQTPQKMKPKIQKEILNADHWEGNYVILGYGLCSNGILGIRASRHPVVIPRVHDCIGLFLGSVDRYIEEHRKEPGTYYLTKGWIEEGKSPLGIYKEYCNQYGREIAELTIREEFKNYTRIALVNKDDLSETHREHAKENAAFLRLSYEEIKGSLKFFEKMLRGSWEKDFIILEPGEEVLQEMFMDF
jgi:hypothetical protein